MSKSNANISEEKTNTFQQKKYTKRIDIKSLQAKKDYINKLDLPMYKPSKYLVRIFLLGAFVSSSYYFLKASALKYISIIRKDGEDLNEDLKNNLSLINSLKKEQSKLMSDYVLMNSYYKVEAEKGILNERYSLLKNAEGLVLETNCGAFANTICYESGDDISSEDLNTIYNNQIDNQKKSKIISIVGIDFNEDLLELGNNLNKKRNSYFMKMDSTEIDFDDEAFDTIVDTFGLQSNYNPEKQLKEMIRVCKPGGKILLLEFGEGYWLSDNIKMIRNAIQQSKTNSLNGVLYRNWEKYINAHANEIEVIKRKRKINGKLYYYEIRKKEQKLI